MESSLDALDCANLAMVQACQWAMPCVSSAIAMNWIMHRAPTARGGGVAPAWQGRKLAQRADQQHGADRNRRVAVAATIAMIINVAASITAAARVSRVRSSGGAGRSAAPRHTASMCSAACTATNTSTAVPLHARADTRKPPAQGREQQNSAANRRISTRPARVSGIIRSQCGQCSNPLRVGLCCARQFHARRSGWAYSEAAAQGWKRAGWGAPWSHAGFLSVPDAAPASAAHLDARAANIAATLRINRSPGAGTASSHPRIVIHVKRCASVLRRQCAGDAWMHRGTRCGSGRPPPAQSRIVTWPPWRSITCRTRFNPIRRLSAGAAGVGRARTRVRAVDWNAGSIVFTTQGSCPARAR